MLKQNYKQGIANYLDYKLEMFLYACKTIYNFLLIQSIKFRFKKTVLGKNLNSRNFYRIENIVSFRTKRKQIENRIVCYYQKKRNYLEGYSS